ncbi:MAG: hypothetical protein HRT72_12000 [Flavobacteriales bacterium]|nr:hypothetical protein [Flavobacteriales bacterium]
MVTTVKKNTLYLISLIAITFVLSGCDALHLGGFSEGAIEFNITYPSVGENDVMVELYPNKMTMQIKDDSYVSDMSAGFGMFKTKYISNYNNKSLTLLVSLLGNKHAVTWDSLNVGKDWPNLEITPTGNTKTIAGYSCDEAIIINKDLDGAEYKIYYTDEISVKGSNWDKEFKGIPGFLMEYQMTRYGLEMKFTCSKVEKKEVPKSLFEKPTEGYEFISEEKMAAIFENFQ